MGVRRQYEGAWSRLVVLDEDGFRVLPAASSYPYAFLEDDYEGTGRYQAVVHFARFDDQIICVGLDIRGFYEGLPFRLEGGELVDSPPRIAVDPHTGPLDSQRLRLFSLGGFIDAARKEISDSLVSGLAMDKVGDKSSGPNAQRLRQWSDKPRRPGRPASLTDEQLLELVVRTFLDAPRRRQEAVRLALQEAGALPGNGLHGEVTTEQAKKAIALARKHNLFPKEER